MNHEPDGSVRLTAGAIRELISIFGALGIEGPDIDVDDLKTVSFSRVNVPQEAPKPMHEDDELVTACAVEIAAACDIEPQSDALANGVRTILRIAEERRRG